MIREKPISLQKNIFPLVIKLTYENEAVKAKVNFNIDFHLLKTFINIFYADFNGIGTTPVASTPHFENA